MTRTVLAVLLWFGTLSALAGMVLAFNAEAIGVPSSYLEGSPFGTYLVPGLVLGIVVGGTQAAAAVALRLRSRPALALAGVAGFGMLIWIFVELAVIGEYSFLQTVYFGLGALQLIAVLALLGIAPSLFQPDRRA